MTERLEIKRLGFLDLLMEEAEKNTEHAEEKFDADFALMTGELAGLFRPYWTSSAERLWKNGPDSRSVGPSSE